MVRLRLVREIGAVLLAKFALLLALFYLFFAHPSANDAATLAARIVGR